MLVELAQKTLRNDVESHVVYFPHGGSPIFPRMRLIGQHTFTLHDDVARLSHPTLDRR